MSAIFDEHKQHYDPDTGQLLVGAKIYVGEPGLDPKLNPKNAYSNRDLTGAALAQPQLTGADGRSINKIWVSGRYSFIIDNSEDVEKYNELQNGSDEVVGNIQTTNSLGVNDITATGVPVQTAYTDNKTYIVTAPADNTGAMTINLDAIGVIPIKKAHDQALVSGDVKADMKLVLVYNSTDGWMELQSAVLGSVFGGRASFTLNDDVDLLGVSGSVVIGGDGTGQHIAIDANEIESKSNATTAGLLSLQQDGGTCTIGGVTPVSAFTVKATSMTLNTLEVMSANVGLRTKVIDIGDWNMSSATGTTNVSVAHGLTRTKIRGITVTIRNDADTNHYDMSSAMNNSSATDNSSFLANDTNISISRSNGGFFDSTSFDSTSFNRGWIVIQYID